MKPTLLLIMDGWGLAAPSSGNAPFLAKTPNLDALTAICPHTSLEASGRAVGLPSGYIGNSEVGHLTIGTGRVVFQDMTRIDIAIEQGELAANDVFLTLLRAIKAQGGRLHLLGLLSDGGVHSHIHHVKELASIASALQVPVRVHCFMDGRDTPPNHGLRYMRDLQAHLNSLHDARVASIVGRYYAMDRDNHWERIVQAWNLLLQGKGLRQSDPVAALEAAYAADESDEFIKPRLIGDPADACLHDNDGLFFFNFRADRMRQLVKAFILPDFDEFARGTLPHFAGMASMTSYEASFTLPVAFRKDALTMGLGESAALAGLKQLHIAETEKYAHVTYFFNGGNEQAYPNEDRIVVDSPRDVATYDEKPEMSAREVTDRFLAVWDNYDLVICNLANGDMVGHTGNLSAAITACEVVDECVGRMVTAVRARKGRMMIIADHGNCEVMIDDAGKPSTCHTTNLVPCILLDEDANVHLRAGGKLADVAPTLLHLWNMPIPEAMTGRSLVEENRG